MALTNASTYNALTWAQSKENPGFQPTYQGPDTFAYSKTFTVEDTGIDTVYAVEGTLAALGSTTIDLQSLTDFFNDPIVFTRVYSMQMQVIGGDLQWGPGAVDPCVWFFGSATDRMVVKDGSDFQYATDYPFTVSASARNLDLYNSSPTSALTYSLVILGGQGAGTTSTTTTSGTTQTSSTTPAGTSSSSSSTAT